MARPRRRPDAPDTRDRILQAARIEFAAQGIAAPLEAIAARCGIRRPSLLHHFPSKAALVAAVTEDVLRKARERLLATIARGGGYQQTVQNIVNVLRELEAEEHGVGAVLIHAMLAEADSGPVTDRLAEFVDIITAMAQMAGADRKRPPDEMRAAIAHLVIGELARMALGDQAARIWGPADGVDPLYHSYFLD